MAMSSGSWSRGVDGAGGASGARRFLRPRLLPRRAPRWRTLAILVAIGLLAWVAWLWYQGSGFVRVRHVTVIGLSGPDVSQIRAALTSTALGMTTMKLQVSKLENAVAAYPYVESITVVRHGAHAITIDVAEQVPVALTEVGGQALVVDGRDQILTDSTIPHGLLPEVRLALSPTGEIVTSSDARAVIAVLAAAPYALLAHIQSAAWNASHGVVVRLRDGPEVYFGPTQQLRQKWQDAVAVLQNSSSAGASYIDVSDPGRPAAGVSVSAAQAQSLGLEPAATTSTQTSAETPTTADP